MQNMKSRKHQGRKRGPRQEALLSHPPQIGSYALTHSTRLRFVATAQAQTQVTYQNLIDLIVWAKTALTVSSVFTQVKIRAVEMWAVPVVGTASTVSCQFNDNNSGVAGDLKLHADTSMGIQPAHIRARPVAKSGAALFQNGAAGNNAFLLTCPSGTVIDVELSYRSTPNLNSNAATASVGATPGAWYYRGLDGLAKAGTQMPAAIDPSQTV